MSADMTAEQIEAAMAAEEALEEAERVNNASFPPPTQVSPEDASEQEKETEGDEEKEEEEEEKEGEKKETRKDVKNPGKTPTAKPKAGLKRPAAANPAMKRPAAAKSSGSGKKPKTDDAVPAEPAEPAEVAETKEKEDGEEDKTEKVEKVEKKTPKEKDSQKKTKEEKKEAKEKKEKKEKPEKTEKTKAKAKVKMTATKRDEERAQSLQIESDKEENEEKEKTEEKDEEVALRDPKKSWFFNKVQAQLPSEIRALWESKSISRADKTKLVNASVEKKGSHYSLNLSNPVISALTETYQSVVGKEFLVINLFLTFPKSIFFWSFVSEIYILIPRFQTFPM